MEFASCRGARGSVYWGQWKGAQRPRSNGNANRRFYNMKIGLIGLGIMGKPMAKNLLKAGYTDLLVSDLNKAAVEEVVAAGATAATNTEIGEQCDLVLTMLPNSPQVKQVMLGEDGVAAHMRPGTTFIDMSSINPVASKEIAAVLAEKNIEMLDAPVSGGEPKAIDGTLSFMVGGKQEVFDKYKDLLGTMGASVVRCGDVGAGNTTKLANQIIVACNIQALAEALTLAQKAGVDPQLVFEAIRGGLAGSTVMNAKAPMMIAGDPKPGFKIDLHIKDLNNALDCAHTVGCPVPMTAEVQEVLQWLHNNGEGQHDHSCIAHYYEKLTGIQIGR
ncbi:2-hydroxy-3-oxopropionate reductase [Subdoligranulum variabile]|nr:2-hydroxy-3-oxopropionate reductase [Subdoligranulum variabile]UWP69778.1 2-hydroxy-3-oxopropionate reductase [Subdoligranulum variabile]